VGISMVISTASITNNCITKHFFDFFDIGDIHLYHYRLGLMEASEA